MLGNRLSLGTEAYVFLLCWKKMLAAQKCDLLRGEQDSRGTEFSTLLSDAQAKPVLGTPHQACALNRWPS